jgi:hypothetical protein
MQTIGSLNLEIKDPVTSGTLKYHNTDCKSASLEFW